MALYTFYPRRADDSPLGFEAHELDNDGQAIIRAAQVLQAHPSAEDVTVFCDDRRVLIRARAGAEPRDAFIP